MGTLPIPMILVWVAPIPTETGRSLSPPPAALSTPEELDEDNSGEISFEEFAEPQEAGLDGVPDGLDGSEGTEHGDGGWRAWRSVSRSHACSASEGIQWAVAVGLLRRLTSLL